MANVQLQRTVNAETFTKTSIDQKQSLEVVQTLLHGGLSSLAYLRNFFNDKVFEMQFYEMSEKIHSYDDYSEGRLTKDERGATNPKTKMRILRRGRSKRADMLLDWLEQGAFIALKDGTLEALNIYIHPNPKDREKVIEQYTFTVKYLPRDGEGQTLVGLEMDGDKIPHVSVGATNAALQSLLQQMMKLCGVLPDLPDERFLSMQIFYREGSKPSKLKDWVPSASDSLYFAESDDWEKRVERLQDLQSGFHGTSFKLSSLQPISRKIEATRPDFEPPKFPTSLQYNTRSSKQEEIQTNEPDRRATEVPDEDGNNTPARASSNTPSTVVESAGNRTSSRRSQVNTGAKKDLIAPSPTSAPFTRAPHQTSKVDAASRTLSLPSEQALLAVSQSADSINTQSSNIPEMRNRLKDMLRAESLTQGDTQTQNLFHHSNARRHRSLGQPQPTFKRSAGTTGPIEKAGPTLMQHTIDRLEKNKQRLRSTTRRQLGKVEGSKGKGGELILCQCESLEDEGATVCCVYCQAWQHLHCYGYTGASDPRLPQNHVCYQCLLGDREEGTLKVLVDLVQKRRGMHLAIESGLTTQRDFARDMCLSSAVAGRLYQHLKKEGYVKDAKGSRKAGYAASGKPLLVAVQDGPNHEKMLKNLFDPIMYIGHHFVMPIGSTTPTASLTQQLLAAQKSNMPPPTTPASKLNKNSQTPESGLDMRASMTPLNTPSHLRNCQPQASKRDRAQDEDEEPSPKRRASTSSFKNHLRSVHTRLIIDGGNISPAPVWVNGSDYIQQSSDASGPHSDI